MLRAIFAEHTEKRRFGAERRHDSDGNGVPVVAERFGFEFCTGNEKDILENPI